MWKTVLLLIITLIIVPFIAFTYDDPLTALQAETLNLLIWIYVIASGLCFIVSTATKNYSQVDKLWSLIPLVYSWVVAYKSGFEPRIVLMASLVTIWGLRLSYNFYRRGGYVWPLWAGDEDYRWAVLKAKPEFKPVWKWTLFNFFFISFYQMGLILLFTLPILKSMGGGSLGLFDLIISLLILGLIVLETVADQQQWIYQNEKHRLIKEGKELTGIYAKGFVHTGLWAKMRHPNYFAEQAIWVAFYFFSVVSTGHWVNWSLTGALLLILLFKGSSDFSEEISASKYPDYKEYQKKVPRFIPYKW